MNIEINHYVSGCTFLELYEGSAWTWEGLVFDESVAEDIREAFELSGLLAEDCECLRFYVTSGDEMNREYGLTGSNAYKKDLTIVSIPLDCLTDKAIIARFTMGARWFDDIVDNNRRREEEKRGAAWA